MAWTGAFFSFRGRVGRTSWWLSTAVVAIMLALHVALVDEASLVAAARMIGRSPAALFFVWALAAAWWVTLGWIFLAASVRRLADRGHSGWRLVLFLAPAVIAAHFIGRHWPAELAMVASLAWMVGELGLLPGITEAAADGDAG